MLNVGARGYLRGNVVEWDGNQWLTLTGKPAEDAILYCPTCDIAHLSEDNDACLGRIPGANSACCGHGRHVGYVNWPGIPAPEGWVCGAYRLSSREDAVPGHDRETTKGIR